MINFIVFYQKKKDLELKFDPLGLLSDEPARRPADLLIPRITIDFMVVSLFRANKGYSVIEEYIVLKRRD